jgi:type I restriction enzyme S subunit
MNNDNTLPNIPNKWAYARLGDICKTTSGGTPSRKNSSYFLGNIPWLKSGELENNIIINTEESITEEALNNSSAKIIPDGTLLLALYGATVGRLGILGIDAAINQAICAIFTSEKLDNKYLFWYLFSYRNELLNDRVGGAQPNISQQIVNDIIIPLPPLAEQHRIVAKIEELFTKLDAGVESINKIRTSLVQYRQSILSAACSGRLTADWRATHKEVGKGDLFENIVNERKKFIINVPTEENSLIHYRNIPDTWTSISLDTLAIKITSGSRAWKKYYCENGPGTFILSQNVRPLKLDLHDSFGVNPPENDPDRRRTEVKEDDLLITIAGNTGDVCRVKSPLSQHYVCQSVALLRPAIKELSPYLELYLNSPDHGQIQFNKLSYGQGRPHLLLDHLKATSILLPPLPEQQEIVRRVDALLSMIDSIETSIDIAMKQAETMSQAILKNAFEGKLVPQDPNDEPAEKLLERIRAGRALNEVGKERAPGRKRGRQTAIVESDGVPGVRLRKSGTV